MLGGNKGGLFGSLAADFSPAAAAAAMSRLAKMSARVMGELGFSIGIDDVMPRQQLLREKAATLDAGYSSVQSYIGERGEGGKKVGRRGREKKGGEEGGEREGEREDQRAKL